MHALADNVKRLRYSYDLTQKSLAKKLETTQQNISEIERGTRIPDVAFLCRLSEFFNVSTDDILYNSKVIPNSKNNSAKHNIPSELLLLLRDDKDEVELMIDFLLYRKKIKERHRK